MSPPILRTKRLNKWYSNSHVLSDIDFSLDKGDVHAIMGPNGAGKSTFVKIIFGETSPTSGSIFINGQSKCFSSPRSAMRNGIAMLSQDLGLIDAMTIAENFALNIQDDRWPIYRKRTQNTITSAKLAKFGVYIDVTKVVDELSITEKQSIAIAKLLSQDAEVYIFDEPTTVLGDQAFQLLKSAIVELKKKGKAVLYVTHKLHEVFEVADTFSVFKNGSIALAGNTEQFKQKDLHLFFSVPEKSFFQSCIADNIPVILEVNNLSTSSYHGLNFSVKPGESVGLFDENIGRAGDVVKAIAGIIKQKSGIVWLKGKKVSGNYCKNMRSKLGFLPEDRRAYGIFSELSVEDNLSLLQVKSLSKWGWINKRKVHANTLERIKQLGIVCKSAAQPANELSGGNQQKVLFGRWIDYDFEVLMLIEPTAGIDIGSRYEIYVIINKLRRAGKSFLVVSSEKEELHSICDRIIQLAEFESKSNPA